jgi:hypothetical protein
MMIVQTVKYTYAYETDVSWEYAAPIISVENVPPK